MAYAYATTNLLAGLAAASFTPTGGPSDATRSYLNDSRMDKRYAFNATASTVTMAFDLGSAQTVAGVAVLNSNIASAVAGLFVLQGATDAAFTAGLTTAYSRGSVNVVAPRNKDHVIQIVAVSKRYWRVVFQWTGTFTLSVGEFFLYGAPTVLTRGSVYGSGESEEYFDVANEMMYGDSRAYLLGGPRRSKHLRFSDFSATDKAEHRALWGATRGRVTPLLWIEKYDAFTDSSDEAQECIFGRLWNPSWQWTQDDYGVYQPSELEIRSLGREVGA